MRDGNKKILFIVTQSEMGGAQRYIVEVASVLSKRGFEILIAAGEGDGKLFEQFSISNNQLSIKLLALKHLKRIPKPWQAVFSVGEIFKVLKRERPDVLFLCSTMAGILGCLASLFYKLMINNQLSIIYRIGGWAFRDPRPWWQRKVIILAEKLTAPLKDKIIVNSEVDRQLAIKYRIAPAKKIIKIYNAIDPCSLKFFSEQKARECLSSKVKTQKLRLQLKTQNLKVVGTIANFYKTKGLKYLIAAAHWLSFNLQVKSSKIFIIGDGPERKRLEDLIQKYKLENQVFLLGKIPDAYKYLKAFDVFVLPSLKEGFPWALLEAMTAGVPIVATKVGAVPEIIEDNKSGSLVEPKDSENLAKKIQDILSNPELANQLVASAKEKLKEFSKDKMIEQTIKIIDY